MNNKCRCKCGNITVAGVVQLNDRIPSMILKDKQNYQGDTFQVFLIKNHALTIHESANASITEIEKNIFLVTCTKCDHAISLYKIQNKCYSFYQGVPVTKNDRVSTPQPRLRHKSTNIIESINKYIYFPEKARRGSDVMNVLNENEGGVADQTPDDEEEFIDDSDYDVMFSAKSVPFIGCFTEKLINEISDSPKFS